MVHFNMLVYLYIGIYCSEGGNGQNGSPSSKPVINVQYEVKSLSVIKETRYHRCFILLSSAATQNQKAEASSAFSLLPFVNPLKR